MIKAIFFDIDDTILDYDKCALFTVRRACETLGVPYSEAVQTEYRRVDDALWAQQKAGVLTIPQVLDKRNAHMMDYLGLTDGISFQEAFIAAFAESADLVEGVEAVLAACKEKGLPLYCASNGFMEVQVNRLTKAGVLHYFEQLFVSQSIGYEKPNIRFFEHCLEQTGYTPEAVLMVGDSLTADIKGALNAGWNVCYLNRHNRPSGLNITEITSWEQFPHIYL